MFLAAMICSVLMVNAQALRKGDKFINLGLGLPYYSGLTSTFLPITGSFDYCVKDHLFDAKSALTIGGELSYFGTKSAFSINGYEAGFRYRNIAFGVRGDLHYHFLDNLDTYAGLTIGYDHVSATYYGSKDITTNISPSAGAPYWHIHLGARYFFTPSIGAFGELGYGLFPVTFGVAFKL